MKHISFLSHLKAKQEGGLQVGTILSEGKAYELKAAGVDFKVGMGGEVVKDLLSKVDIDILIET